MTEGFTRSISQKNRIPTARHYSLLMDYSLKEKKKTKQIKFRIKSKTVQIVTTKRKKKEKNKHNKTTTNKPHT